MYGKRKYRKRRLSVWLDVYLDRNVSKLAWRLQSFNLSPKGRWTVAGVPFPQRIPRADASGAGWSQMNADVR